MDNKFKPFLTAILKPDLESIDGLNDLTTEEIVNFVSSLPNETILGLAMRNPQKEGQFGFLLNPRAFNLANDQYRTAAIMKVLLDRFSQAQKETADWEVYVCHFREA